MPLIPENLRVSCDGRKELPLARVNYPVREFSVKNSDSSITTYNVRFHENTYTIYNLLFYEDFSAILRADKNMTFGQYLHQQLEMFDFSEAIS